ncbi:MAG TPA: putative Ig domain-containing protein, partial [Acidobacteriaceae bacterium]
MRVWAKAVITLGIGAGLMSQGCGSGTVIIAMVSPSISQVSPQVVTAGTPSVTVTVQGTNFQTQSSLTVNGTAVPTTVVNSTTIAAKISGDALAKPVVNQLQVKNTNGAASNQVSLTVTTAPQSGDSLSISTTNLPSAQAGTGYNSTLSASGGTPGYTWSVASGSLPAGLTLSSAGVISGTPTASGTSSFSLSVSDSSSPAQSQTVTFSIVVLPVIPTLSIGSGSLPAAQVGASYANALSVTGGTPGYTWSIASGSLPAGLTLSSAGVISGTPTASGSSTFTVSVTDAGSPAQIASAQESVTVKAAGLIISSGALAAGKTGGQYSATLSASGGTPG